MADNESFQYNFEIRDGSFQYGPPQTPDVMRFTTSGELLSKAYQKVDSFFISNLKYIGFMTEEEILHNTEIIQRWLVRDQGVESEDRINILLAFERPIASALETRTLFNHIQINCASYIEDLKYLAELRAHLNTYREGMESLRKAKA